MNTIWTYGNNDWNSEFKLTKLELITAFASITLWKYFYPNSTTYLYCDESVKEYLTKVDLIQFWDVVDTSFLQEQDVYKRKAFWTIDKIRLFQHIQAPFTFIDFDLYIKQRLPEYTNYDYIVAFTEDTKQYYPYYYDNGFKSLKFPKEFTFKDIAHNTCIFYVSNSDITNKYTDMCLSYMRDINDVAGIHGGHSVFLEQTILYELSIVNQWKTKSIVNKKFNVLNEIWTDVDCDGMLSPIECESYFRHLSNDKRRLNETDKKVLLIKSEIIELTKKYNPQLLPNLFKLIKK